MKRDGATRRARTSKNSEGCLWRMLRVSVSSYQFSPATDRSRCAKLRSEGQTGRCLIELLFFCLPTPSLSPDWSVASAGSSRSRLPARLVSIHHPVNHDVVVRGSSSTQLPPPHELYPLSTHQKQESNSSPCSPAASSPPGPSRGSPPEPPPSPDLKSAISPKKTS